MSDLKAYTVTEYGEGNSAVVFAKNGAAARRLGAVRLDLAFLDVDSCVRSPEFDQYASTGDIPPLVLISAGWWIECAYCGHELTDSYEGPDGEELEPVADGVRVYCSTAHMMAEWQERRDRERRAAASIEACATKFHHMDVAGVISGLRGTLHYSAGGRETVECCDFDFVGRTGLLARWDVGDTNVYISECDRAAWAKATGGATA
jgi:hypothetical protein